MTRLINLDDEIIVLYANETKAKSFKEEESENFRQEAVKFFNEMIEAEGGPSTEELRAEKLHEEYLDDCKSDDMEAMGMDESIEYNDE